MERAGLLRYHGFANLSFSGGFVAGDAIVLTLNGTALRKDVYPSDTLSTIASHFAAYINEIFVGAWAAARGGTLTITGRSPAPFYDLSIWLTTTLASGSTGVAAVTGQPQPGIYNDNDWIISDAVSPPVNRAARDWHADLYAQCASRGREIVTSCSMEPC